MQRLLQIHAETRDAVVWTIDVSQRWAGVKVQGSDKVVRAYFPQNLEETPGWLKVGNSVRITHTGGNRGRVELVGHGILKPTPVAGGSEPGEATQADAVLSGLMVQQIPQGTWLRVLVTTGVVRFSGVEYTIGGLTMGNGSNYEMSMGGDIGSIAWISPNITVPGGYCYDLIVIGSDLVIHLVVGSTGTPPVMPAVPSGHLLLGFILMHSGMTAITQGTINMQYSPAVASALNMNIGDSDLAWGEMTTGVTVGIYDQYGNAALKSGEGWYITLSIVHGNGTLSYGGSSGTSLSIYSGATHNYVTFTYTRPGGSGDITPQLTATIEGKSFIAHGMIILRDIDGNIMI
jgi:hypothetical protein